MRWIEVSTTPGHRTVAAWADAMRQRSDDTRLATIRESALRPDPGPPLVALEAAAAQTAWQHVRAGTVERGGLLLGEPLVACAGQQRPAVVYVRAAVAGMEDEATSLSLRLQAGVWDAARAALQPGEIVVGWYHSHPGIGAFFSSTDRRTQAGFFHYPFSLGWVIDPQRREQAWFVGARSEALPGASIIVLAER